MYLRIFFYNLFLQFKIIFYYLYYLYYQMSTVNSNLNVHNFVIPSTNKMIFLNCIEFWEKWYKIHIDIFFEYILIFFTHFHFQQFIFVKCIFPKLNSFLTSKISTPNVPPNGPFIILKFTLMPFHKLPFLLSQFPVAHLTKPSSSPIGCYTTSTKPARMLK